MAIIIAPRSLRPQITVGGPSTIARGGHQLNAVSHPDAFSPSVLAPLQPLTLLSAVGSEPSAYVAHLKPRALAPAAIVDGVEVPVQVASRTAGFIAEAGKPLIIRVDPERFLPAPDTLELSWRHVNDGVEHRAPFSQSRDPLGNLIIAPFHLDIPSDAVGPMRLRLVSTRDGQQSTQWHTSQDVRVAPKESTTAFFSSDGIVGLDGSLRAGDTLKLAYDLARLRAQLNGEAPTRVVASLRFNSGAIEEYPLVVTAASGGETRLRPAVPVPWEATDVEVWFRAERASGEPVWDSAGGRNHSFPIAPARPDGDPSWKVMALNSRAVSFPNLTADRFVATGPSTGAYNCIACSLGIRDRWVWPGDTVAAFDGLYARSGYTPLATLDAALDPRLEKVAVFGGVYGGKTEVAHAARQEPDGRWLSKLGPDPLILHDTLEVVEGKSYGKALRIYARPRGWQPTE